MREKRRRIPQHSGVWRRMLSVMLAFAMVVTIGGFGDVTVVKAASAVAGAFTVTGGAEGTDYSYANGVLTINTETALEIKNTNHNEATADRILVANGVNANITLAGVNIAPTSGAAFEIADNSAGNVTVTLADGTTNTLQGGPAGAGLQKTNNNDTEGTLTIEGNGTLNAIGGANAAGIGGKGKKFYNHTMNITINSGTITAIAGNSAGYRQNTGAGIGGGGSGIGETWYNAGNAKNIIINGGTIVASGNPEVNNDDYASSGIGSGYGGTADNIQITGGTVTAIGAYQSSGIGSGSKGTARNIKITGGVVTATGNDDASGIGAGNPGTCENIVIGNASVKATPGSKCKNAIGTYNSSVTPVNESGASVYYWEQETDGENALIIDETVTYPSNHNNENKLYLWLVGADYALVNGGTTTTLVYDVDAQQFRVSGTAKATGDFDVVTEDGDYSYVSSENKLCITKAGTYTISNKEGITTTKQQIYVNAGVSANITLNGVVIEQDRNTEKTAFEIAENSTGNVTITLADGSNNILKGGRYCAALQKNNTFGNASADVASFGTLTINGTGKLTATGGLAGAGIGGAFNYGSANIVIENGNIIASSSGSGAGIGGGDSGVGKNIQINGGVITASGGTINGGAGIGGGEDRNAADIQINGGSVKVTAGEGAYAIGGGGGRNYATSALTPVNSSNEAVYLLIIPTNGADTLRIDTKDYPVNHNEEGKSYVWLAGKNHTAIIGDTAYPITFDESTQLFTIEGQENADTGDFTVTGGSYGTDYTYDENNHILYIKGTNALTIKNTNDGETSDQIVISSGVDANITLAGVNIVQPQTQRRAAIEIAENSTGNVTITLADGSTNKLVGGQYVAGLQKNSDENSGNLTIKGAGTLEVSGYYNSGASIGAATSKSVYNITLVRVSKVVK